jgi:exosortase C (VPDSG-CTERM-specific)
MRAENEPQVVPMNPSLMEHRVENPAAHLAQARRLVWLMAALLLCFSVPLYQLARFAAGSELYSYVLLMPFVTIYLVWPKRKNLWDGAKPARGYAAGFFLAGALMLLGYWLAVRSGRKLAMEDQLAFTISSWFLLLSGIFCFSLGRRALRGIIIPVGLLAFMIPIPVAAMARIETFLQYSSAWVADWMFKLAFTPHTLKGLVFGLSDISIIVAPECSGIHSTWILLITSLLAGHLFLRSPWKRAVLVLAVLPLALLRNGFRIFTIGELCVHIGPDMIDSPIHHRGGPLFFALSLIPFFLLLTWLYRSERGRGESTSNQG